MHSRPGAVELRTSLNRWLVSIRLACLVGLLATSVSLSWWTLALGAALALSYCWSATRLSAVGSGDQERRPRNPLRGKPRAATLADLAEPELLELRANSFADVVDGAEDCAALLAFRPVQMGTACVFARRARLWGSPNWRPRLSLTANAAACAPRLRVFCRLCVPLGLDGFVLQLPANRCGDFRKFSAAVYGSLSALAACENEADDCMRDLARIHRNGWVFRFHGQTFFVTTFAPFYGPEDSRYAHGASEGFILLQPEVSFAQHDLPPDTPDTNWGGSDDPAGQTVRDRIRCAFRDAGQAYRIRETAAYPMIEDIVMLPKRQPELAGLRWWEVGRNGPAVELGALTD